MFAAVTPLQKDVTGRLPARIYRSICRKIRPPEAQIFRVEILDSFFTDMRLPVTKGAFNTTWKSAVRLTCRGALCPPGFDLPEGFHRAVTEAEMHEWYAHVLCNTALKALEYSSLPLYCRRVGIIDETCAFPFLLEKLIRHLPEVVVYTRNDTLYQGYSEEIMEEYGAPIIMTDDLTSMGRVSIVLNLSGTDLPALHPIPVLSLLPAEGNNLLVQQLHVHFPPVEAVRPSGIEPIAFYAALYARCHIKMLASLYAHTAACGKRCITIQDIAEQVTRNQQNVFCI